MEGRNPYRIYDPGGTIPKVFSGQSENMEGIPTLGELLEESQNVALDLHRKAEVLVKGNQDLHCSTSPSSSAADLKEMDAVKGQAEDFLHVSMPDRKSEESNTTLKNSQKPPPSGNSSEFEILDHCEKRKIPEARLSDPGPCAQNEDDNLHRHLLRMENSLSLFAEESDKNRLLSHMSRLALEFNRLANKVHKNDQRTSILQTLCEQLRKENEDLRSKLEADWKKRSRAEQAMRYENLELKMLILDRGKTTAEENGEKLPPGESTANIESATHQQAAKEPVKAANKDQTGILLKKVKALEHQRAELLEVNKQWDQQFRSMKQQYEEKITSLRQKLSQAAKSETEQESERDRKQRDFDRKLLLARDKIEEKESQIQTLESEIRDLKQKNKFLHDQLASICKQRDYQEREIGRLNKALEEALKLQGTSPRSPSFTFSADETALPPRKELVTQIELLKQQVTIFEEDFKRERSDRERMNEEKEDLKKQLEQTKTQLRSCKEDLRREKQNVLDSTRKQTVQDRYILNPLIAPACPPYQYPYSPPGPAYPGFDDWHIYYPPPVVAPEHSQVHELPNAAPPAYRWRLSSVPPHPLKEEEKARKREPDGPTRGTQKPS